MGNEDHLLARTAVLAGEIMLVSGAEIARIEGTIQYILSSCPGRKAQSMVFSTGIFVSLDSGDGEPITLVRRVEDRSTNLGRIYLVNQVSRKLCGGEMAPAEAYEELERIQAGSQYKKWLKALNYMFIAFFLRYCAGGEALWTAELPLLLEAYWVWWYMWHPVSCLMTFVPMCWEHFHWASVPW